MFNERFMGLSAREQLAWGFSSAYLGLTLAGWGSQRLEQNSCSVVQAQTQSTETQPVYDCPPFVKPVETLGGSGIIIGATFASVAMVSTIKRLSHKNKS